MKRQRYFERTDQEEETSTWATPAEGATLRVARMLDWAPRDPSLFLPKLFRDTPPPPPVELPTEDVDDERLLSAFDQGEGGQAERPDPERPDPERPDPERPDPERPDPERPDPERPDPEKEGGGDSEEVKQAAHNSNEISGSGRVTAQAKRRQKTRDARRAHDLQQHQDQLTHLDPLSNVKPHPSGGGHLGDDSDQQAQQIEMQPVIIEELDLSESWKNRPRRVRKRGGVPLLSIEDPRGAMRPFFKRLAQAKSGRKVRVMHYGDSLIAGDYVTSTMRRLLQKRFGYGGVGYVLAGKPSPWYGRTGLTLKSKHWKADRATRSTSSSSSYGLGGVSFRSKSKRAYLSAEVKKQDQLDARVDTFELHYLRQPKGGQVSVQFGPTSQVVSTHAEEVGPARVIVKAPLGLHKVEVRPEGDGEVLLLGMSLERAGGGVVYDSLGLTGSRAQQQLKWDRAHWSQQALWRSPDLFVIHYGTNESENTRMSMSKYATVLRQVIQRHRSANPQASCLFVSPMDRAYKDEESGRISTRPIIPKIVRTQREVALSEGCAFWSAYDAMGGWGSLKRWYRASPPLAGGDLTHPTRRGANLLGAMFFSAMMEAYGQGGGR